LQHRSENRGEQFVRSAGICRQLPTIFLVRATDDRSVTAVNGEAPELDTPPSLADFISGCGPAI
jgi:hypothetical protein